MQTSEAKAQYADATQKARSTARGSGLVVPCRWGPRSIRGSDANFFRGGERDSGPTRLKVKCTFGLAENTHKWLLQPHVYGW